MEHIRSAACTTRAFATIPIAITDAIEDGRIEPGATVVFAAFGGGFTWAAADLGLNVIYAGHYATETVGVQALGRQLVQEFGLETRFFDFPTRM